MTALARWCLRRRLVVVVLWCAVLVGVATSAVLAGSAYSNKYDVPGTESGRANTLLSQGFPDRGGDSDTIVWKTGRPRRRTRAPTASGTPRSSRRWTGRWTTSPRCRASARSAARTRRRRSPSTVRDEGSWPSGTWGSHQPRRPHRLRDRHLRRSLRASWRRRTCRPSSTPRSEPATTCRTGRAARRTGHRPHRGAGRAPERGRRHRRRGRRAAARLRFVRRDAAAACDRARQRRHGHAGDRAAQPRDDRRRLRADAGDPDRARRRHRLRAVHRHPSQARA